MKIIEILSEKQENGLWGVPLNCVSISNFYLSGYELIVSAIIVAVDEKFNKKFSILYSKDHISFTIDNKLYTCFYYKYEVVDNILYEFDDKKEHTSFLRQKKIKQLENFC